MAILFLFIVFFVTISIGVPIGFAIGGATLLTFMIYSEMPTIVVAQFSVTGLDSFPMMAIPFFILAGAIMGAGGVAKRLIDAAIGFIGFITGGLGAVVAVASMFFAAISGSALATVSAIGGFMIPEMTKKGYDVGYSAALTACAGTIGVIIPPSIPLVIYGVCTQTSIGDLFLAGIIPGILIGVGIMIANYFVCKKQGYGANEKPQPLKLSLKRLWEAKWAVLTPVIILGGIYAGIFTPTEASVVAVVYSAVISLFVYREMSFRMLYKTIVSTAVVNGITSFLLGLSSAFAAYLSLENVPKMLLNALLGVTDNKFLLLLLINIALLLIGCVVDNIPATIILSPILLPVAVSLGLTPVQFGLILTVNLTIGLVTPPYGCNLFVAAAVANIKMEVMLRKLWPFLVALFAVLMLITYVPGVTTFILG
ncbi:MAG: TRAP transporter large permease [Clostridiales Family XIII bacterium]|jgi:C4-dicarboxylate transporter DctM subunit|nr:TRAP transporter large permease [Clostridiales Family XIII bacterium]